jgi:hypothetical protein
MKSPKPKILTAPLISPNPEPGLPRTVEELARYRWAHGGPYRTIRSRRGTPLLPHRFLAPFRAMLIELTELVHGVAVELADERWARAASALERAIEALREVSR